jgi:hypothetical protein
LELVRDPVTAIIEYRTRSQALQVEHRGQLIGERLAVMMRHVRA